MSNNNLIPFSKELWETGEYEMLTRNLGANLMLRKKTKKVWIPTWKNTVNYATKQECEADNSDDPCFLQAIEVEI